MIFVSVGNPLQSFGRLLDSVEALTGMDPFGTEDVFIQTGHNPDFKSQKCETRDFLGMEEFQTKIQEASLVICHGGVGTVMSAVRAGKLPVVMARRKKFGEHIDDHQVQVVEALAAEGMLVPAFTPADLPSAVQEARSKSFRLPPPVPTKMLSLVEEAIGEVLGHP